MFARFDENPAMTLRVIKKTKRYGRAHTWTTLKQYYHHKQSLRGYKYKTGRQQSCPGGTNLK